MAAEDPDSEYAYTYDNIGRVLTVSHSGTSGVPTVVLTSAYNANSRRTSLSATIGGTADFLDTLTYDNLSRLTRLDQTGNGGATVANKRTDFEYNALGQFTTITRQVKPSSTWNEVATSTYTYDSLNRITALDHKHGSTDIANYDWTYDAMDRVTQLSDGDGTSDYTYDKESEVTAADHSFQTDESYTYDATGNRTNGSYTVGSNNRMTSDGTYNYTYDDEGNRLTRTKISDSSLTEYTWDHRNRLTRVVERAAGAGQPITKQTDYKYDVYDRRISKSADADGAGAGSAVVSRYVYYGDNIALQFDGSNNLTHRYLHGPAVDQILADEDATNDILWPLTDNLGTVRDLVDDSGAVQNHLKYDAFGKVTAESNAAVDHLFAYTGRERDEESGLYYYRRRYYDPLVGRFLSRDPIGFAAGDPNLSRYVDNNTANRSDPFGLYDITTPTIRVGDYYQYSIGAMTYRALGHETDESISDISEGSGGASSPVQAIYAFTEPPTFFEMYQDCFLPGYEPPAVDGWDSALSVGKWVGWGMAVVGTSGVVVVEGTGIGAGVVIFGSAGTAGSGTAAAVDTAVESAALTDEEAAFLSQIKNLPAPPPPGWDTLPPEIGPWDIGL